MPKDIVYWTMRDGQKISIDDMDINHLRNTLKMILRKAQSKPKPERFRLNGEMAQMFNDDMELEDDDMDSFDPHCFDPVWDVYMK